MDHILSLPEIVRQIVSYMNINELFCFGSTNKLNNKIVNIHINSIDEDTFLKDNKITVCNKSYEFYCNVKINITKLQSLYNFELRFKHKRKTCIKYRINNIHITINKHNNMTRFTISGCKTTESTHIIINNLFKLLLDNGKIDHIPKYKLIPVKVTATFISNFSRPQFTKVNTNRPHVHLRCDNLIINSHKQHIVYKKFTNGTVNVNYSNFKIFYITYGIFAKLK